MIQSMGRVLLCVVAACALWFVPAVAESPSDMVDCGINGPFVRMSRAECDRRIRAFEAESARRSAVVPALSTPKAKALIARLEEIKRENWRRYNDNEALNRTLQAWTSAQEAVHRDWLRCTSEGQTLRVPIPIEECKAVYFSSHAAIVAWDWQSKP